ncbi:MAG: hypothetical protein WBV55_15615 [Candidatus Sulfotelmatobacter sp.]
MLEQDDKNWRQLCNAALEAKDPNELLHIVQELNNALKREEQLNHNLQESRNRKTSKEAQC